MSEPGTINDEAIEWLRRRIGIPEPHPVAPHYLCPDVDAFRQVAEAYGDDNPLWSDETYGAASPWGSVIAPPPLVGGDSLIGEDEVTEVAPQWRDLMRGDPLRGVHAFYAASAREWWRPLRPGKRVRRRNALVGVFDKASEFAGRAVHEWTGQVFQDEDGEVLSGQYRLMVRTERAKAKEKKKYDAVEVAPYTDEEIDRIDRTYASEAPLGAARRVVGRRQCGGPGGADGQRSADRHRHHLLARRHGDGPLRRQASAARFSEPPTDPAVFPSRRPQHP